MNKLVQISFVSLEELVSMWGVEDMEGFRDGCWERIKEIASRQTKVKKKKTKDRVKGLKELEVLLEEIDNKNYFRKE